MSGFSHVTWRLWLVLSFAVIIITAATALQTRDLLVPVGATAVSTHPAACVPGTVSKPVSDDALLGGSPAAGVSPTTAELGCTSWWEVGRRASIAAGVCLFAGLVLLGFFWVASAGRRREKR